MSSNNANLRATADGIVTVKLSDTGVKGRPGLVFRGEWDGTKIYYVGDVVKSNGSSWIASKYTVANATGFPHVTPDNWDLFTEKGDRGIAGTTVGPTAPLGSCSIDSYTTQGICNANGGLWTLPQIGDLWFDTTIGRLYSRVEDAQGDEVWFDISGVVGSMDAANIFVATDGDLPSGSLQEVLKHLEDELFKQATAPVGLTVEEGDLWYDTTENQMKFYRNGVWEVIAQTSAMADTNGYDDIHMNGGYF